MKLRSGKVVEKKIKKKDQKPKKRCSRCARNPGARCAACMVGSFGSAAAYTEWYNKTTSGGKAPRRQVVAPPQRRTAPQ